jgi:hypothetical protein
LRFGWPLRPSRRRDPYWDFFINTPPADLANSAVEMIRSAPQGNIFPTKADIHTPEVTASHVKDLARYLGADLVGIVRLEPRNSVSKDVEASYPFGVISAVRAAYDPREARNRRPGAGSERIVHHFRSKRMDTRTGISRDRRRGYRTGAARGARRAGDHRERRETDDA